ncbi:hypothetical protein [Kosakonia radicincitans]|nr:hypothetical protein [Kosakonia radicincitans]
MKEQKTERVTVRLSVSQEQFLQTLIAAGKAKNISSAIQYLITMAMIKGL